MPAPRPERTHTVDEEPTPAPTPKAKPRKTVRTKAAPRPQAKRGRPRQYTDAERKERARESTRRYTAKKEVVPRRLGVNKGQQKAEDRAREVVRLTAMLPTLSDGDWHPLSWWCECVGVEYVRHGATRAPITSALKPAGAVKRAFGGRTDGVQWTENRYRILLPGQVDQPRQPSMTRAAIAQRRHRARMRQNAR